MIFDYFTVTALLDEFNQHLAGGRLQDVVEIDDRSLGLEVYANQQRHYLYMTAELEQPRMHLVEGKLRRGTLQPSPLGLLLKRRVVGGKLIAVRQPPWERILIFDILHAEREFALIFEPIERRANILLVEDETIREVIRRVRPEDQKRGRLLLPGQPYAPPHPQIKTAPQDASLEDIQNALLSKPEDKAFLGLVRHIHGVSPLLGREIIHKAGADPQALAKDISADAVWQAFQKLMAPLLARDWQPGHLIDEDDDSVAFAVYPLQTEPGTWQPTPTVSDAITAYYGMVSGDQAYEAAKKPILRQIKNAAKKLGGKLFSLKQQERDDAEIETLRKSGELLLAYQYMIEDKATSFSAQYDPEEPALDIKLNPDLTPIENANRYFEKYEKAKRSRLALPDLILQTERDLRYLDQLETDLELATNWDDIGEVQDALVKGGFWQGRKARHTTGGGKSGPLRVITDDGTLIWVGRNSRQNEDVTFKKASPDDLWLHVRGVAGAHVVVKSAGRAVPDDVLDYAAAMAAYYSKARADAFADVIVTERKHIRSIKGGNPGQVRVMRQSQATRRVAPRPAED